MSFYVKASEVKSAFYTNQPIFVLLSKEACFNTNELVESLPSVVVSLLQDGMLSHATKNKTYTPKNICSSASKDRSHGKYLA